MKLNLRDIIYTTVIAGALTIAANACDNYHTKYSVNHTDKKVSVIEEKFLFGNPKCRIEANKKGVESDFDDNVLLPQNAKFYINGEMYDDGDSIKCDTSGKYSGRVFPKTDKQINGSYAREE